MRRNDRQVSEEEAREVLANGEYAVFSMVDENGRPYSVPLSYCVTDDAVYFHCADEGAKLDHLRRDPHASVCVVGRTEVLPAKFTTRYESCVVTGIASEVFGDEKRSALEGLIAKYSPDHLESGARYIDEQGDETVVVKVAIETITGKARR